MSRRRRPRSKAVRPLLGVLGVLVLLIALVAAGCSGGDPASTVGEEELPAPAGADEGAEEGAEEAPESGETVESGVAPLQREQVNIYFPSSRADGLVAERREIFATATPGDRIKQIVNDLISGPATPNALRALPSGTQLRQVFVVDDGTAYLDFSIELAQEMRGGSTRELLTVYAIVDSVVMNVRGVRRVALLVNGQPVETLNGHMDLRRPLTANTALVLRG